MAKAPAALGPIGIALDALQAGSAAIDTINKIVPQLEDEVTVEVRGQPGTTKQQLYFLALAAANGMVRRFDNLANMVAPSQGMLMIEYDGADDWVRCTIRYKWSCLSATVLRVDNLPSPGTFYDNVAVYRGPSCNVVGDNFDFVNQFPFLTIGLPGIPATAASPDAPQLPFDDQMILTGCPTTEEPKPKAITQNPVPDRPLERNGTVIPSPNPKPPGDNRSRGNVVTNAYMAANPPSPGSTTQGSQQTPSPGQLNASCCEKVMALIPLVFAALSQGASNADTTYPVPVTGPRGF